MDEHLEGTRVSSGRAREPGPAASPSEQFCDGQVAVFRDLTITERRGAGDAACEYADGPYLVACCRDSPSR